MGFIASIKKKIVKKKTTKTLKFTTTFHCGGCVKKVQPYLDAVEGIHSWDVELNNVNRILKVEADKERVDQITEEVKSALEKEGYKAELVN